MTRIVMSLALCALLSCSDASLATEPTKLSRNKICHAPGSQYYARVKHFTAFQNLAFCLQAGGRLAKGSSSALPELVRDNKYQRKLFVHWIDSDGDCQNTRHELLAKLSTGPLTYATPCRVDHGRWLDPYTNKVFVDAQQLDIDHLIPLKWAWDHGANLWSAPLRRQFANDERNLFAVQASTNRDKGAAGPLHWLPPNAAFHCQYISRFIRISLIYQLRLSQKIHHLQERKCAD